MLHKVARDHTLLPEHSGYTLVFLSRGWRISSMESPSQPPTKQHIESTDHQQHPDTRTLDPSELVGMFGAVSTPESPEEECAAAHRSGELFEGSYRGDGR